MPTSDATLPATEVAATRRGWVQAITLPSAAQPDSSKYCGNSRRPVKESLDGNSLVLTGSLSTAGLTDNYDNAIYFQAIQQLVL